MKKILLLLLIFLYSNIKAQSKDDLYNGFNKLSSGLNKTISNNIKKSDTTTFIFIGADYGILNKKFSEYFDNTKGVTLGFEKYVSNKSSFYLSFGYSILNGKSILNFNILGKNITLKSPKFQIFTISAGPKIKTGNLGIGLLFGVLNFSNTESKTNSNNLFINPYLNYRLDHLVLEIKNQYAFTDKLTDIDSFNSLILSLKVNIK